jgi:hypothetical protein
MKIWLLISAAGAVALSIANPAAAQATGDVKCLMASNLFSKAAKDPKARTVAEAAKYFYLGRVSGRLNEQQLRAQMQTQSKTITRANAGNVMNACTRQMQSGAAMIERVGKQLATPKK